MIRNYGSMSIEEKAASEKNAVMLLEWWMKGGLAGNNVIRVNDIYDIVLHTNVPIEIVKRIRVVMLLKAGTVSNSDFIEMTGISEDEVRRINVIVLLFNPNTEYSDSDVATMIGMDEGEVKCIKVAAWLKMGLIHDSVLDSVVLSMKISVDDVRRVEEELSKCGTLLYVL
jgi:hypothetical protein